MQFGAITKPAPVFHLNTGRSKKEFPMLGIRSIPVRGLGQRVPITRRHKSKIDGAIYDAQDEFVGGTFIEGGLRMMLHLTWKKDVGIGSVYGLVADANKPMVPRFAVGYWAEPLFSKNVWTYVFRHYLNAVVKHADAPMRIGGDAAVLQPAHEEGAVIATLNPLNPMTTAVDGPCNLQHVKHLAEAIAVVAFNYRECGTPNWSK